jgi:capsular exopolysaccharide synthesis family protein
MCCDRCLRVKPIFNARKVAVDNLTNTLLGSLGANPRLPKRVIMSRIFDALQRSERERPGADPASLPEGPEFLHDAERHTLSKWYDSPSENEPPAPQTLGFGALRGSGIALVDIPKVVDIPDSVPAQVDDRRGFFAQLKSSPISLPAQSRLVCLTDWESPTAEALRLLTVRLRDLRRVRPLKVVLITSTIPQEGKSTIAGNLACALARGKEERTLLIEGDLRRPSLSRMFGIETGLGICDSLRDDSGNLQGLRHLEGAGFWLFPAGQAPGNPLEPLQSPRLPALIKQLTTQFDWIIVDSPPALPLADTSVWMRLADGIILVTRQGTTQRRQLRKGLEAIDPHKLLGAIINGATASAYSSYYYQISDQS